MTRILLDTHAFLWWVADAPSLSGPARRAIQDEAALVNLSIASVWELAIKQSLGKLTLPQRADLFVTEQLRINRFQLLPLELRHAGRVATLPFHHRDPFDRILIAQALEDALQLATADPVMKEYGVSTVW